MEETFVPGAYTVTNESVYIRTQMKTDIGSNIVGSFKNGEPFTVFEVYPEQKGIVWGRVSSNTGGGQLRFVALRVNNHPKATLEIPFASENTGMAGLIHSINNLTAAIQLLVDSHK